VYAAGTASAPAEQAAAAAAAPLMLPTSQGQPSAATVPSFGPPVSMAGMSAPVAYGIAAAPYGVVAPAGAASMRTAAPAPALAPAPAPYGAALLPGAQPAAAVGAAAPATMLLPYASVAAPGGYTTPKGQPAAAALALPGAAPGGAMAAGEGAGSELHMEAGRRRDQGLLGSCDNCCVCD
jgi:hypothetical protein